MEDRLGSSDSSFKAENLQKITDQTVDRCMCGAVQGLWWQKDHPYPMRNRHLFGAHSPLGCFRTGGSVSEVQTLYYKIAGHRSFALTERQLYQSLMTMLAELPSETVENLGVVVVPTKLHSPVPYVEITPPVSLPAGGGVVVPPQKILPKFVMPAWDQNTGKIKPPWVK